MGSKKRQRYNNNLHSNTSLNLFCYKQTEENIDDIEKYIEDEFNTLLKEQIEEDKLIKKNVLNNIILDKVEFERKYNIKYNIQF